jgi:hypothetical protein
MGGQGFCRGIARTSSISSVSCKRSIRASLFVLQHRAITFPLAVGSTGAIVLPVICLGLRTSAAVSGKNLHPGTRLGVDDFVATERRSV